MRFHYDKTVPRGMVPNHSLETAPHHPIVSPRRLLQQWGLRFSMRLGRDTEPNQTTTEWIWKSLHIFCLLQTLQKVPVVLSIKALLPSGAASALPASLTSPLPPPALCSTHRGPLRVLWAHGAVPHFQALACAVPFAWNVLPAHPRMTGPSSFFRSQVKNFLLRKVFSVNPL